MFPKLGFKNLDMLFGFRWADAWVIPLIIKDTDASASANTKAIYLPREVLQ